MLTVLQEFPSKCKAIQSHKSIFKPWVEALVWPRKLNQGWGEVFSRVEI